MPHRAQSVTIWHSMAQYSTIWHNVAQSVTPWHNMARSGTIWQNMTQYSTILHNMAQNGTMYVAQYGTVWNNMVRYGTVHHCGFGPLLLWRVTCSCGPGQTNAGAKSIFRCEENLNAARRWWATSPSSDLWFFFWKPDNGNPNWHSNMVQSLEYWGSRWQYVLDLCTIWWTEKVHLWCIWYLFVFVFLVTGISLDHMVGWVQLWSLVPFSFKTAPPLLQRCKNTHLLLKIQWAPNNAGWIAVNYTN